MKKILSFILFVLVTLGAILCTTSCRAESLSYEEQKALYDDVIAEYTACLQAKESGQALTAPDTSGMNEQRAAVAEAIYTIVDAWEEVQKLGYGYKDMDKDGTPELLLMNQATGIRAILTLSKGQPKLLDAVAKNEYILFAPEGRLLIAHNVKNDRSEERTYSAAYVDGESLRYDVVIGQVIETDEETGKRSITEKFQVIDGERVTLKENTYNQLYWEFGEAINVGYGTISKLQAPRVHLPLVPLVDEASLPVADFSDYEAIRRTYIAVCSAVDEYNKFEFEAGNYDNLFSFPNDEAFEYYIQFLHMSIAEGDRMGYDEIDLNGDGQDELVLLDDHYYIQAIFTQKDGVPALLCAFPLGYENAWLDEQGLIHVDHEDYYELRYGLYEFTREGEYRHHYTVIAQQYGRHLRKDGKTEIIPFDQSLEIYHEEYQCYPDDFQPNEYARHVSALCYTPLTEVSGNTLEAAAKETWARDEHLEDEETTEKFLIMEYTRLTFGGVDSASPTMLIQYEYSYCYPDPERENYSLGASEESELTLSLYKDGDVYRFDESGVRGYIELGSKVLWLVIEESHDERFSVGYHCYKIYDESQYLP